MIDPSIYLVPRYLLARSIHEWIKFFTCNALTALTARVPTPAALVGTPAWQAWASVTDRFYVHTMMGPKEATKKAPIGRRNPPPPEPQPMGNLTLVSATGAWSSLGSSVILFFSCFLFLAEVCMLEQQRLGDLQICNL